MALLIKKLVGILSHDTTPPTPGGEGLDFSVDTNSMYVPVIF